MTFGVGILGLSICKIMPSANRNSFSSSIPTWIPFIYFTCLIALARNSNTMLNITGRSRHPCLVSDIREEAYILSPLNMMLSVDFLVDVL